MGSEDAEPNIPNNPISRVETVYHTRELGEADSEETSISESEYDYLSTSANNEAASSDTKSRDSESLNLPDTVTVLDSVLGGKVYVVGTVHYSEKSWKDVEETIRKTKPNVVVLELCESRLSILSLDKINNFEEAAKIDFASVRKLVNEFGVVQGIMRLLFNSISASIASELGIVPGGEFRTAFREAQKIPGCTVWLGDRPVNITLSRAINELYFWQKIKFAFQVFRTEELTGDDIERFKDLDLLEKFLTQVCDEFPSLSRVFREERDIYLAYSLQLASFPSPSSNQTGKLQPPTVVAVVGIGHVSGIVRHWRKVNHDDIPPLMMIPTASMGMRIFKKSIKFSTLAIIVWLSYKHLIPQRMSDTIRTATSTLFHVIKRSLKIQ